MKIIISLLGLLLLGTFTSLHGQSSSDPSVATSLGYLVDGTQLISITVPSDPTFTSQVISVAPDITQRLFQEEIARPMMTPVPMVVCPP